MPVELRHPHKAECFRIVHLAPYLQMFSWLPLLALGPPRFTGQILPHRFAYHLRQRQIFPPCLGLQSCFELAVNSYREYQSVWLAHALSFGVISAIISRSRAPSLSSCSTTCPFNATNQSL